MRIFTTTLLAASAISLSLLGSASAAPVGAKVLTDEAVAQQVAVVCDRSGRCYDTNRRRAKTNESRSRNRAYRNSRPAYRQGHRHGHQSSPGIGIGVGPQGLGITVR